MSLNKMKKVHFTTTWNFSMRNEKNFTKFNTNSRKKHTRKLISQYFSLCIISFKIKKSYDEQKKTTIKTEPNTKNPNFKMAEVIYFPFFRTLSRSLHLFSQSVKITSTFHRKCQDKHVWNKMRNKISTISTFLKCKLSGRQKVKVIEWLREREREREIGRAKSLLLLFYLLRDLVYAICDDNNVCSFDIQCSKMFSMIGGKTTEMSIHCSI